MSSLMEKSKLKAAFGSAETTEQMLKAFHQMEMSESCDETDIGLASIIFGFHLISVEDFDKALTFAIRAFKSLKVLDAETNTNNPSLPVSNALNLMGLKRAFTPKLPSVASAEMCVLEVLKCKSQICT
ncbi:hypothetical protein RIF29_20981 [Crotalaria pallida]|uniref:Uncharacterized protein n=1 Tax=Crotalaria pallida TaxID=3830 RepID=A0AAN9I944_CROPI